MVKLLTNIIAAISIFGCGSSYIPPASDTSRPGIQERGSDSNKNTDVIYDGGAQDTGEAPDLSTDAYSAPPCVTIEWFLDYQDRFNRQFFEETYPSILKNYVNNTDRNNVEFQYRHFPLPVHRNARQAAEAAECARRQSSFLPYQSHLFEQQQDWAESRKAAGLFRKYAASLGMNDHLFGNCLENGGAAPTLDADWKEGVARGVVGVPAFFINDEFLMGAHSYDTFSEIIDGQLKECR